MCSGREGPRWLPGVLTVPVSVRTMESAPDYWIGRLDDMDLEVYGSNQADVLEKLQACVQKTVSDLFLGHHFAARKSKEKKGP